MLVLNLETDEKAIIQCGGEVIEVMLCRTSKDHARIGFEAAKHVLIDREEVYLQKQARKEGAA